MGRAGSILLAVTLFAMALPPSALAQAYRWVDDQGKVHYSEGVDSVPLKYRGTSTPIEFPKAPPPPEKPEAEGKPAAPGGPPQTPPGSQPATPGEPEKKETSG